VTHEDTPFTTGIAVGDAETSAENLALDASSSDADLIPLANIRFFGSSGNRTLTIIPATNRFGAAMIGISVTDTSGGIVTTNFVLTVNAVNDPPSLAPLSDIAIRLGGTGSVATHNVALSNITSGAFNENDDLLVTATNDHPGLFSAFTLEYSSPSATGMLYLTPAASSNGTAVVSVTVNDRQPTNNVVTHSFVVTIRPALALQITRLGSLVVVSFDTTPGESYTLEYKNSLSDSSWTPLGSARPGTGSTLTISDELFAATSRFYRVRIQ
jgi:hypothetical protein